MRRDRAERDGDAGSTRSDGRRGAGRRAARRRRCGWWSCSPTGASIRRCSRATMQQALPAPVVGCTTIGVIGATAAAPSRGRGRSLRRLVARRHRRRDRAAEVALARSRDAVHQRGRRARHDRRTHSTPRRTSRSRSSTAAAATKKRFASRRPRPRRRSAWSVARPSTEHRLESPRVRVGQRRGARRCRHRRVAREQAAVRGRDVVAPGRDRDEDRRHRAQPAARSSELDGRPRRSACASWSASSATSRRPSRVLVRALRRRHAVRAIDARTSRARAFISRARSKSATCCG